jgi:predicted RNA-binding protein Jag
MKSLMEEASSIAKAIEKAWERAGNPREFTVKVLDKPKKNFFGFTTKSAKVAILFEEEPAPYIQRQPVRQDRSQQPQQPRQQRQQVTQPKKNEGFSDRTRRPRQEQAQQTSPQQMGEKFPAPASQRVHEPIWTPERIAFIRQWVADMQKAMNKSDISYDISTDRNAIRIIFQRPLVEDSEQEKQLFRSWAYLIMQTLRHTYKQQFKHIKIILKSGIA